MNNGWTGGQYSVYRVLFGAYLAVHFAQLIPWGTEVFSSAGVLPADASPLLRAFPNVLALNDSPATVTALLGLGVGLSALLACGWKDRWATVVLWYLWACLFGRNPLISNPGLPYVGLLLVVHAFLPRAPYGSWERHGQADPGADWRMPKELYLAVWTLMALGYSYSGWTKLMSASWLDGSAARFVLDGPLARPGALREAMLSLPDGVLRVLSYAALGLELLFAPLALLRRLRPLLWMSLLVMHVFLIALIDFADLSLGMVMLHVFTFDPAWIRPRAAKGVEIVFYDGYCGLCHRTVRLVLSEDAAGAFRFAPLQGEAFARTIPGDRRAGLPDSIVVLTDGGETLVRSEAVLHILARLGGLWRLLAALVGLVPRTLRDDIYDGIARVRKHIFATPDAACPILPAPLRARFDP
ncbi:MAG: DCC1-like thiol-disulfide oxidoreductase family protein [Myxococcota bacterium]